MKKILLWIGVTFLVLVGLGVWGYLYFNAHYYFVKGEGISMSPTLPDGTIVLIQKDGYELHRGDIISYTVPGEKLGRIKRIVGMPGETIEGDDNRILINGKPLKEPYLKTQQEFYNFMPVKIPPKHVFVLGDYRKASIDSRITGPVPFSRINGKVVWVIKPDEK
jgi:signal peptidase I